RHKIGESATWAIAKTGVTYSQVLDSRPNGRPPRRAARHAGFGRLILVRHVFCGRQPLRLRVERADVHDEKLLAALFHHGAQIAAAAAAEDEVGRLVAEPVARERRNILVNKTGAARGIRGVDGAVLPAETALAGTHEPFANRLLGPVFEPDRTAVAIPAVDAHFRVLEGRRSNSAAGGMACSASRRSSGGAISLRFARSSQPPSLVMRAASLPSPFRISLRSRKREPSGARPESSSVTVIGSSSPISRKYSSSSRRTTGPMRRFANSVTGKPCALKKPMR